jgi:hypothetical protein
MTKPQARRPVGLVVILARDSGRSERKLKNADADVAHVDKEGNDLDDGRRRSARPGRPNAERHEDTDGLSSAVHPALPPADEDRAQAVSAAGATLTHGHSGRIIVGANDERGSRWQMQRLSS